MVSSAQYRALRTSAEILQTSPRRVHDLIRTAIREGSLEPDEQLVEDVLVRSLATSRNAVREALQLLADEGLVRRERRVGTTVVGGLLQLRLDEIVTTRTPQHVTVTRLDDREVPGTDLIRGRLGVRDARVGMIEHLFLFRGEPIGVRVAYYRAGVVQPEGWDGCPDAATAFEAVFGTRLGRVETTIDAVPCEARTSRLLGVPVGSPVLVREQLLVDVDGVVREFAYLHYRADRVSFVATATRPGHGGDANGGVATAPDAEPRWPGPA